MTYLYKYQLEFVTPPTKFEPTTRSILHGPDGPNCPGFLVPFKSLTHDDGVPIRTYSAKMCGDGSEFYFAWRFTNLLYAEGNYLTTLLTKSLTQERADCLIVDFVEDTPIYSWYWHFQLYSPRFTED